MADHHLDLRGLKCPLPALRTRQRLAVLTPGDRLVVECTDPLAAVDIPHLLQETRNILDSIARDGDVLRFIICKR